MVRLVGELVEAESPSEDIPLVGACAELLAARGAALLGARPEWLTTGQRPHLRWRFGAPRVLVLGHLDTVWPAGTIRRWPFAVDRERVTGPGVFDMKAGVVMALQAIASLPDPTGVELLVTTDEETGLVDSRELILQEARGVQAVLVLEPSLDGALKTERKGSARYRLRVGGRAAHAGLEPEKGVNATVELALQVPGIAALGDARSGTTVTPTSARAGEVHNQVPASAHVDIDVRAVSEQELRRVDDSLRGLRPVLPDASLHLDGGIDRGPLSAESSAALYDLAARCADDIGIPVPGRASAGGGSDGNFTAGAGLPTLDGLGAVGGNAHAEGEWMDARHLAGRTALVARMLQVLAE
jgi:glutamate carboxypeptidase